MRRFCQIEINDISMLVYSIEINLRTVLHSILKEKRQNTTYETKRTKEIPNSKEENIQNRIP